MSLSLRFSSLNLQNFAVPPLASYEFDNIYSQAQWQQKTSWLRRTIAAAAPDVLLLQEVFSVDELRQLLLELGYSHFGAAAEPLLVDGHFYLQPVVAIASRYPLKQHHLPEPDAALLKALGLHHFQFSRTPLAATVYLPGIGACDFYGVHLKSRRALTAVLEQGGSDRLGRFAACAQRGYEAAILMELVLRQQQLRGHPVVLAGDFNDDLQSGFLQPLTMAGAALQLKDSWDLWSDAPQARPATHYYGAKGSVLDYLLMSADFDTLQAHSLAGVSEVHIRDQHLLKPDYQLDAYSSDHAMVTVTIQLRH